MTRSTVFVRDTEVLDVFHDHDREHAVIIKVGGTDHSEIRVPEASPSDITIRGYSIDDESWENYNVTSSQTFEVFHGDERVARGETDGRTSSALVAEVGGSIVEVPPNQRLGIHVYGEEVED